TAAPSAPNRTPATAEREATAQAGSTAGQVERRAFQIPATVPPAPHPRSAGSTATDDLLEPAPRSSRSRTAHRSSHPNRASDVPHISSRSADYTPTPGPIERLFPHPAKHRTMALTAPESGECRLKEVLMKIPVQVIPAAWSAVGGAIAAMIIGFTWGGWMTGGTFEKNARAAAQTAVVEAFVPLCVAKAEQKPEQLILLKKQGFYSRHDFVVKAGWVSDVAEEYR